jgi:phasin family protein
MNPTFENTMSRIADKARGRYARLVKSARQRTESAADRVVLGKKPVKTITGLGLKLTAISHKTADQVLRQQTRLVEHQIDAVAHRLKAAAEASNLGELVRTQLRLIPQNVAKIASDTRDTFSIVASAGVEVRDVLKGTISELRGKTTAARKTSSGKAPARKARSANAKRKPKALARKASAETGAAATSGNSQAA